MITGNDLLGVLSKMNAEELSRIVILGSDALGDKHSPLSSIIGGIYDKTNEYMGNAGLDNVLHGEPAIILYPIN